MSITDINLDFEERARFASALDLVAKEATRTAKALRAENYTDALVSLVTMSLFMCALDDLRDAFKKPLTAEVPDDASSLVPNN